MAETEMVHTYEISRDPYDPPPMTWAVCGMSRNMPTDSAPGPLEGLSLVAEESSDHSAPAGKGNLTEIQAADIPAESLKTYFHTLYFRLP